MAIRHVISTQHIKLVMGYLNITSPMTTGKAIIGIRWYIYSGKRLEPNHCNQLFSTQIFMDNITTINAKATAMMLGLSPRKYGPCPCVKTKTANKTNNIGK